MYALIIFTMMQPNVEPMWQHLEPIREGLCLERKQRFEELFAKTEGLAFSLTCERVEEDKEDKK